MWLVSRYLRQRQSNMQRGTCFHFKSDTNRGHMSVNRLDTAPDLHVTACTMLLEVDVSAQQLS